MLYALALFGSIVITYVFATELPLVENLLLNVFIYAAILSLLVGMSVKDRLTWI
jgi:hypothetical protein